jgi:hypothetical protein
VTGLSGINPPAPFLCRGAVTMGRRKGQMLDLVGTLVFAIFAGTWLGLW